MQTQLNQPIVRPAQPGDAPCLAPRLRKADIAELSALRGIEPGVALLEGYHVSTVCFSLTLEDKTLAMFGAAPSADQVGCVWLLGSEEMLNQRSWFIRNSRPWLARLHQIYPTLFNYVDKRNTAHIRWLKWLGFSFKQLHPDFGVSSLPFYEFWRSR